MSIGNANFTSNFNIDGNTLPIVTSCRDLGVVVTHNLFPSTHIDALVIKAHQRYPPVLCFTQHKFRPTSSRIFVYVRPLLECNCVIWSPWLKQDIDKIERVQRRFTKRLPGFKYLSYIERLLQVNLTSLELRRLHADLVMCYKLIFGHVECKLGDSLLLTHQQLPEATCISCIKNLSKNSVKKSFFSERVVSIWNFLPADIVNFT